MHSCMVNTWSIGMLVLEEILEPLPSFVGKTNGIHLNWMVCFIIQMPLKNNF